MLDASFACPDLTTFGRLDALGLEAVAQRLEADRAVLAAEWWSPMSGAAGADVRAERETPWCAGSRTSRSVGVPRCCC